MAEFGQEPVAEAPIGDRLRIAREEKGLSLDEVARQTRIPIRHLQHIEQEEWDALPAITYTVGFVRSYANAIGLDGPAIGAELREQLGGTPRIGGPAAAHYEPADPARVPPRSLAILAAVLAVLLIAGYLTWRHYALGGGSADSAVAEAPQASAPGPAAAPRPAPPPATGPVVLAATDAVWLSIHEANGGKSLYLGTMKAGDKFQIPADAVAPVIITGRPNALQVTVGNSVIPPLGEPEKRIKDVSLKPADLIARIRPGAATPPSPSARPPGTAH